MRRALAVLCLTLTPTWFACSTAQRVKAEKTVAKALISDEQEEAIGRQVHQELQNQEGVRFSNDPVVTDYVRSIVGRLIPAAAKDRAVEWKLFVIDDPNQVNAFATPGGYIYVYSGLLQDAKNEAEVAGVLAHEMGHVVGRHSARQLVQAYGLQTVLNLALGKDPSVAAQIAASLGAQGLLLAHGRSEELEADRYAVHYTSATGYDPHGIVNFFQQLQKEQGNTPRVLSWLSTHPPTGDRIAQARDIIQEDNLRGSYTGDGRLQQVKQRIVAAR